MISFSKAETSKDNGQPLSAITVYRGDDEIGVIEAQYDRRSELGASWVCLGYAFSSFVDDVNDRNTERGEDDNSSQSALARIKREIKAEAK